MAFVVVVIFDGAEMGIAGRVMTLMKVGGAWWKRREWRGSSTG